jgi:hypothetical protein
VSSVVNSEPRTTLHQIEFPAGDVLPATHSYLCRTGFETGGMLATPAVIAVAFFHFTCVLCV